MWSKTEFEGVWVFEPTIWKDERGYFIETFNASQLPDELKGTTFVQDNEAYSHYGVLRGLHYQLPPHAQAKLVRCVSGKVLDVIVDLRQDSQTFGQYFSLVLDGELKNQMFVPHGFAHGYIVLSESAIFAYKCDQFYHSESEAGILFNDDKIGIDWVLPEADVIVSDKDKKLPTFKNHRVYK